MQKCGTLPWSLPFGGAEPHALTFNHNAHDDHHNATTASTKKVYK